MNKTELVHQLSSLMLVTQQESLRFVEAMQTVIAAELQQNGSIVMQGFGRFVCWEQAERPGRNPRTGKPCQIPQRTSVKFKPGKKLLEALNLEG